MKYMRTCCCGSCSVETGTKILSILGAISCATSLSGSITQTFRSEHDTAGTFEVERWPFCVYNVAVTQAVVSTIGCSVCVLCAVGAFQRRQNLLLPYLVFQGLGLVGMVVIFFLLIFSAGTFASFVEDPIDSRKREALQTIQSAVVSTAIAAVISLSISVYYYIVVLSYYKSLEAAEQQKLEFSVAYATVPNAGHPEGQAYPTEPPYLAQAAYPLPAYPIQDKPYLAGAPPCYTPGPNPPPYYSKSDMV